MGCGCGGSGGAAARARAIAERRAAAAQEPSRSGPNAPGYYSGPERPSKPAENAPKGA